MFSNHGVKYESVYGRSKLKHPRTTDSLEGYHRHLNSFLSALNTNLLKFKKIYRWNRNLNNKKSGKHVQVFWTYKVKL